MVLDVWRRRTRGEEEGDLVSVLPRIQDQFLIFPFGLGNRLPPRFAIIGNILLRQFAVQNSLWYEIVHGEPRLFTLGLFRAHNGGSLNSLDMRQADISCRARFATYSCAAS